jgi:hypothetical protein
MQRSELISTRHMKDLEAVRRSRLFRERGSVATPPCAVIGLEAEFNLLINGRRRRPEKVFGDPGRLVRRRMIPRTGKSFQSPAGGAIYFDTGVIEVATPIIELEGGCCYRATRLLWEQIRYLRVELDHWAKRNGCQCRLQGFSTHYNFSFPRSRKSKFRNATKLAYLLAHILPVPVLLLATNRQSSAVGIRPRRTRLEVTADFTPDPGLMLATCAFIAGVMETVLRWENFDLKQLNRNGVPRVTPLRLRKHSSRRGWRVTADSFGRNPFTADLSAPLWKLRDGRKLSLRAIAAEILGPFRRRIRRISDLDTLEHIGAVFVGDARSLLDFEKRPEAYDDVGRTIDWGRRSNRRWSRSKYEKIIHRVIAREPMRIAGKRYRVARMNGWYQVDFREIGTNRRRTFNLDELVQLSAAKRSARGASRKGKRSKKRRD